MESLPGITDKRRKHNLTLPPPFRYMKSYLNGWEHCMEERIVDLIIIVLTLPGSLDNYSFVSGIQNMGPRRFYHITSDFMIIMGCKKKLISAPLGYSFPQG